jgi:hypothetical protein
MVVTDLHGDWDAYRRYRDYFVDLQAAGQVDYLVFTGDLIHPENSRQPDRSLEIVQDVLALQASYGRAIIYMCGNHELPHIYGISLTKGEREFTPAFEAALAGIPNRAEIIDLFDRLPFFLRTRAGVSLAHAGAAAPMANSVDAHKIFQWSHQSLLLWADQTIAVESAASLRAGYARLQQVDYDMLARHYLAVSGPDDPRYNDLLRGFLASNHPTFHQLLWPVLFTRCEQEYGLADYRIFLEALLTELSTEFFPQQFLVAGHMPVAKGHQVVAKQHLRLASAHHATPREAGRYLLFDAARPVNRMTELLAGLGSVY